MSKMQLVHVLSILGGLLVWAAPGYSAGPGPPSAAASTEASSVTIVRRDAQRYDPDGEFIGKVQVAGSLESLLQDRHFAAEDLAVFVEAMGRLLHRTELGAGDVIAIHGVRQGAQCPYLRPVQLSIYSGGAYVGTLSRADDGMVVLGADPWVYENLRSYSGAAAPSPLPLPPPAGPTPAPRAVTTEVALEKERGTLLVPVLINNAITLGFVVDSGAADVTIPADVVGTLMRAGTISSEDFLGPQTYTLADGSAVTSETFRIRSLKVGDLVLENVMASMAPASGVLLLGQSFLGNFRSWSIDNGRGVLVLVSDAVAVAGDPARAVKP